MNSHAFRLGMFALMVTFSACASPETVAQTEMPIFVDASGLTPCISDLGYVVTLTEARVVVADFDFMIGGQPHSKSWYERVKDALIATAYAHPEHLQGGIVDGHMAGRVVVDWVLSDRASLGMAQLRPDVYASANFDLVRASELDGLSGDDALLGHTAMLAGTAEREGVTTEFSVLLDSPLDRRLIGAPFQVDVSVDDPRALGFQLLTVDPFEHDTLFDGVDFAALDARSSEPMALREDTDDAFLRDAYYAVRRAFQTHDHFRIDVVPSP